MPLLLCVIASQIHLKVMKFQEVAMENFANMAPGISFKQKNPINVIWTKPKVKAFSKWMKIKKLLYILTYKSRNFGRFLNFFLNSTFTRVKSKTLKNWLFLHFEDFDRWKKDLKISEFWTYFWTYFFNLTYMRVDLYASIYGNLFTSEVNITKLSGWTH